MNAAAPALPGLRQELRLEPGMPQVDGAPGWTLLDPLRHLFFHLGEIEFTILSRWAAGRIDEIAPLLAARGMSPEAIDIAFARTVEFSLKNALVETPMGDSVATFTEQRAAARKSWWKWLIDNYLFIRIPLVRPARFLERTLPAVAPLWSQAGLTIFVLLAITGLFLVTQQWDAFVSAFLYFFSWEGLAAYAAGLFAVKVIHELGHAYTATRFGARVPTMGVSILVMVPMLYTDTSGAWRLRSRRQRLLVDCAGVSAELMAATIATWAWLILPDGALRSTAFILATTSWILSVAINLNPFMRFDGYYALSDWMGVPNLQPRAFAFGRWRLRELLFGLGDPPPEAVSPRLQRTMIVYAWLTWLYRLVLFVGIAILVYHLFFAPLGIILAAVEIGVFVARPVYTELHAWAGMRDRIARSERWRWLAALAGGALLLACLPVDRHITAPAVLAPVGDAPLVSKEPAQITRIFVRNGQEVKAGAPLLELRAPELDSAGEVARVRIAQMQAQLDRSGSDALDLSNRQILESALARERAGLEGIERRADTLVLRAAIDGRVTDLSPESHPGRWVAAGHLFARVVSERDYDVQAYVREADIERLPAEARGQFIANDSTGARNVRLVERSANAVEWIDQPALASVNGGVIAVETDPKSERLRPRQALYRVRLLATKGAGDAGTIPQEVAGFVTIRADSEPPILHWLAALTRLWRQESDLSG